MQMTMNDFQKLSMRTIPKNRSHKDLLTNFVLGAIGECAEVSEHIKKHVFHEHALDKSLVEKELGDVLFYIAGLATLFSLDLDKVASGNIEKLKNRFPNGFDPQASINRVEYERVEYTGPDRNPNGSF